MKCFWHRECAGDIIYALMALRAYYAITGEQISLGISRNGANGYDQFQALRRLVEAQPYIAEFHEQNDAGGAVDMRYMIDNSLINIGPTLPREYHTHLGLPWDGYKPWLEGISPPLDPEPYTVVNVTTRYRDKGFQWGPVLPAGEMRFLGTDVEHATFYRQLCDTGYGDAAARLIYVPTLDLYDCARQIAGAQALFCNASACLVLAQGLGQRAIFAEFDENTTNTCRFGHEVVLNAHITP